MRIEDAISKGKTAIAATAAVALVSMMGLSPIVSFADETTNEEASTEQVDESTADETIADDETSSTDDAESDAEAEDEEADDDDDDDDKVIEIDADKIKEIVSETVYPYQTRSELSKYFKIFNSGSLKGVWGSLEDMSTFETHETWNASNDYVYTYWYETIDANGDPVIGGLGKTNDESSDDTKAEISVDQAKDAFERYTDRYDWSKLELVTDPDLDPTTDEDTSCSMTFKEEQEINGYKVLRYEGELFRSEITYITYAYVVIDGDTASWATVSVKESKTSPDALDKLDQKVLGLVRSYQTGSGFTRSSGSLFDTSVTGNSNGSQVVTTTADGTEITADDLGLGDNVQINTD